MIDLTNIHAYSRKGCDEFDEYIQCHAYSRRGRDGLTNIYMPILGVGVMGLTNICKYILWEITFSIVVSLYHGATKAVFCRTVALFV